MHRRQSRLGTSLAAAALPFALLAGCAGDDPQPRFPEETASSPTEASSPEPTEPTPPPAMEGDDEAAAEAFVEYYFAMVDYVRSTGSTERLRRLALNSCAACEGVAKTIDQTRANGGEIKGGDFSVLSAQLAPLGSVGAETRPFQGVVKLAFTEQIITGSGNDRVNGNYPSGQHRLEVVAIHDQGTWSMASWQVLP